MEKLISHLNKTLYLSLNSSKKLADVISVTNIKKGTTFIKEGKIDKNEYLIFDGTCRSFVVNAKGDDISLSFYVSNAAISPNVTRTKLSNSQSILNIQALTDVKLATFLSEDLMELMSSNREIELWGNSILQNELLQKVAKEINQISMSAEDRLLEFRTLYPQLENLIPHSYIASYLGITNVSLSRIRGRLSTK